LRLDENADFDERFQQQLYPGEYFDDEFIANVRRRLRFEEQERFKVITTSRKHRTERRYEEQLRRYVMRKYPKMRDREKVQEKVLEEKQFDAKQSEIFLSLDRQLHGLLEDNVHTTQDSNDITAPLSSRPQCPAE